MLINLKELAVKGHTVHLTEELDVTSLFEGYNDVLGHGSVQIDLHAKHTAGVVEVSGKLAIDIEQSCSRCLSQVKQTLEIPFREIFTQNLDVLTEDEKEDAHLVTEDKVDVKPYVEENVLLELPFLPLCEEACKGLCPVCGENRNVRDCGCNQDKVDPRLAGLADFFNT